MGEEGLDAQQPMLRSAAIFVVSPAHIDGQASDERASGSPTTRIRQKDWTHSAHTGFRPYIGNFMVLPTPAQRGHSMQRSHLTSNRPVSAIVASTSVGLVDGRVGLERRDATLQNGGRQIDGREPDIATSSVPTRGSHAPHGRGKRGRPYGRAFCVKPVSNERCEIHPY
jgi:hypothetical protein